MMTRVKPFHAWFLGLVMSAAVCGQETHDLSLDAAIERADDWENRLPDRVSVAVDSTHTHGTPEALHMAWKKDLGNIAGTGLPTMPQIPTCWLKLSDDLDLSKHTQLSFWAKIEGTRHGHLHVGFANDKRMWSKDETFKKAINNTPLDAGDWSQYFVTIGHMPPEDRKTFRWMCIGSISVGHQPDEDAVMHVWLDDSRLTSKPLRKWEGWAADPTVVIVSQLGFRRFHEKIGVVDGAVRANEFVVRTVPDGQEAFKGPLRAIKSPVGSYKVADFTALTKPGRYVVHVGELKSLEFRIGDDAYNPCIELLSDWIFNMRCGCKTALHEPCHTDDGTFVRYEGAGKDRREISRQHLDLVGGWHDAGDIRTYYSYTVWMGHQSLRARECGWRRDRDGDGVDDLTDSAIWAMRHLAKIVNPDDGRLLFKIEDWPDYRRGDYWTDGKIGTDDDRHVMDIPGDEEADYVGQACASAGLFARWCGKKYPEIAEAALKVAEGRWAFWFDPENGKKPWKRQPIHVYRHGNHVAKWGQGSLELYLATRKPIYLEFARFCADYIMSYQNRTFYRGGAQPMCGEIFSWLRVHPDRDLPEEFLADMMIELPSDSDYYRWRATLVRSAEWWMKPTRKNWEPFSVPHLEVPAKSFEKGFFGVPIDVGANGETLRYLVPTAYRANLGDTAHGIQGVAQALNDVELEQLIRRQVHWAVGHNPFNVSWICRFGRDSLDQFYSFSQGRMPGCVSGFGIQDDGVPRCVRPNDGESYTQPGARLLRAMIAVNEPASLQLLFQHGSALHKGKVTIRWKPTGETVFEENINANGFVPSISLDGGQHYELLCDGVVVPLDVNSGTSYDRTINVARLIVLSAEKPEPVKPKSPFRVGLAIANCGKDRVTAKVRVHTEDAMTDVPEQSIDLGGGETKTIEWPFIAGEPNRPYVLFFEPDRDRAFGLDVTGEILP